MQIDQTKYTMTIDDSGIITLTPIKEEGKGLRKRVPKREVYFYIDTEGLIGSCNDRTITSDESSFDFGNYYPPRDAAQAVADLRKHVYKVGPVMKGDRFINIDGEFTPINELGSYHTGYDHNRLPLTATQEDLDERIRLLKNCLKEVGYITI